jgi:hypothetical protein
MSGQGRVRKEVGLLDRSAEDVHGERWICLPSSLVVLSMAVLATSEIRSKTRKETVSRKPSRHHLNV